MVKFVFDEEKNIVVTSIFSISLNVFKRLLFQGQYESGLSGKGLTVSQTSLSFYVSAAQVF